jgi:hypothetical protein
MKYRIKKYDNYAGEFDIITEDGGLVSVCSGLGGTISTYYQNRMRPGMTISEALEHLQEGKAYMKEWDYASTHETILQDALAWLVMGQTEWDRDDSIWQDVIPQK